MMPEIPHHIKALLDTMDERVMVVAKHYLSAVRPIYANTLLRPQPQAIGSCILLNLSGARFLLTAAHVIDNSQYANLYVGGEKSLVRVEGEFLSTTKPNDNRDNDHYDFAICKIPSETVRELENVSFVLDEELETGGGNHQGSLFMALGYPISRSDVNNPARSMRSELWVYWDVAKEDSLLGEKLGVTSQSHIFICFDKKRSRDATGQKVNSIRTIGVSGGALINLLISPSHTARNPRCQGVLSGLVIEFYSRHKTIVSTRLGCVMRALKKSGWL